MKKMGIGFKLAHQKQRITGVIFYLKIYSLLNLFRTKKDLVNKTKIVRRKKKIKKITSTRNLDKHTFE